MAVHRRAVLPGGGCFSLYLISGCLSLVSPVEAMLRGQRAGSRSPQLLSWPHFGGCLEQDTSQPALWRDFAEGRATADELFGKIAGEGYNVTMDNPMCDLFAEQMRIFPNAKVVLTEHPKGAAGWAKSFAALLSVVQLQSAPFSLTYPNLLSLFPLFQDINAVRCMMGTVTMDLEPCVLIYGFQDKPAGWLEEQNEKHNARVRATVPQGRLLVFDVTQGWDPLCTFLSRPVPDVPFPYAVNDSTFMRRLGVALQVAIYAWIPCLALSVVLLLRCSCRGTKRKSA